MPLECDLRIKLAVKFRRDIFDWCLRQAKLSARRDELEATLQWSQLAARIGCMDCAVLASAEIEESAMAASRRLKIPAWKRLSQPRRWLHIFSDAGASAGHTAMAWRWMSVDPEPNRHSVVVLSPLTPVAGQLRKKVKQRGGDFICMDPNGSILERAARLRDYAYANADVVILHVHPWELTPTVAFGVPYGPPVLLLNHSAHLFGIGSRIADLMINIRQSAQEDEWSRVYRGMGDRLISLPLVLAEPKWRIRTPQMKAAMRKELGIPQDARVVITVGNSYKYTPLPDRDFLDTALQIARRVEDAHVLAVGVVEDRRWYAARINTAGRVRAFGIQLDLAPFHGAADIYAEGFPMGSTTALLEAAQHGLPCVLAPGSCPPPFASDGAVFDEIGVGQPASIEDYIARIIYLLDNQLEREHWGKRFAESVEKHHAGSGWLAKLANLKKCIPEQHGVYPLDDPPPIPWHLAAFWAAVTNNVRADPLGIVFRLAAQYGLKPRFDPPMLQAIREARSIRTLQPPLQWAMHLTNSVAGWLPDSIGGAFYQSYVSLANLLRDGGKFSRAYASLARVWGSAF